MSDASKALVLPRPGAASPSQAPIPGPSEEAFTAAFGALLPPAQCLTTPTGKAAYFEIPPSAAAGDAADAPHRVFLIHGVQTPALGMLPLARALHASFPRAHFALLDLWGHGLSETPVVPHEATIFHELLDAVLDRLGWPSAHLVAFSFGASLTVGYAASRASRVKTFVLVAPAGLLRVSDFTPEQQNHLRGTDVDETAARKFALDFLEGGDLVVPADWKERVAKGEVVAEAVREWQMREHAGHTASVVAIFRDGGVFDNDAEFVRVVETGIPSLVVLGELDDMCSEGQITRLGFTNVVVVPEVGHPVVRQRVPEVAASISGFWEKGA